MSQEQTETKTSGVAAESKTLNHLKSYPLLNDVFSLVASSALLGSIFSNLKPFFTYLENLVLSIALVKTILVKFDQVFNDIVLNRVDGLAPSLKQVHLQDVHPKALSDKAFSKLHFNEFNGKVKNYEKQIRPAVNNKVEPLIKPLNNKLETFIDFYLPKNTPAGENGATGPSAEDELGRLYNLTSSVYGKTVPVASNEISQIQTHILQTYASNLPTSAEAEGAKTTTPSAAEKLQAAAKTSVALSNEGLQFLNKTYENVKPKIDPYLSKVSDFKVKVGGTLDNAKNNVDALISEAAQGAEASTMNGSSNSQGTN